MKKISIDNGVSFVSIEEVMERCKNCPNYWDQIVALMDDELREQLAERIAPGSEEFFLYCYLLLADDDLIIS